MTAKTQTIDTRHERRATELSPTYSKEHNQRALKTLKKRAAAKRVDRAATKTYTWKDMALALLCASVAYLSIWVWYLALQG